MGRFKQALGRFMTGEKAIRLNAALVIREMRERLGMTLSYDEKSVAWLDDYITSLRPNLTQDTRERLVSVLGSFFGEAVRHRYGGEWRQVEGRWARLVPGLAQAYDRWKKDPRLLREAPRFRPVHPEWIP